MGKQGERSFGFGNRGHSTDATSLPKSKSIPKTNSDIGDDYVAIKLTKDVLQEFEEQTRTRPRALIQAYLLRCEEEPGEIEGLLSNGSSEE